MGSSSVLIDEAVDVGAADLLRAGRYFTDGGNLYRVVCVTSGSGGPRVVELEDCRTLETSLYAGHDLMTLGLREVNAELAALGPR
jgi:hypothetical protein